MLDRWKNLFIKIFFTAACVLSILYLADRILFRLGWDLLWIPVTPDRILQLTLIALLFVVTLTLIQIRDALKK